MSETFTTKITKDQSRDTGLAMVLLLLLVGLRAKREWIFVAAMGLQVLTMTVPQIYKPLAVVWFGISHVLGTVMSKILLSILYFGVVTPIGMFRRLLGRDSLKLRAFGASGESVMVVRNHVFAAQDIEKPY